MTDEVVFFDWWVHFLEVFIVLGIGIVVWTVKKAQHRERD